MSTKHVHLWSNFESSPMKVTWIQKRNEYDQSSFMVRVQLFLQDHPIIGVWIAEIDDDTHNVVRKACYRKEVPVVIDKEGEELLHLQEHYEEFNVFGQIEPSILEIKKAEERVKIDQQAKDAFLVMIDELNSAGIAALNLSLELLFEYPGWQKVEWGTPGVKPGEMSEW